MSELLLARISELEKALQNHTAIPVCCGQGDGNECCGEPDITWPTEVVAVLSHSPKEIRPEDLHISTFRKEGVGGWINTVYKGVRILHIPTGIETECESERSQHQNRGIAMEELRQKTSQVLGRN